MRLDAFWSSPRWHRYEEAYGDRVGTRATLLANCHWKTRILDLSQSDEVLWRGVRRSYHALINKLAREFPSTDDFEYGSSYHDIVFGLGSGTLIAHAQETHLADAGRQTRSDETWRIMGEWAETENGLIAFAIDEAKTPACRAFVYFIIDGEWAYYASAASLDRDLNLFLVWKALVALKARGIRIVELGWQGHARDPKGLGIEFFRRGFGGVDVDVNADV